MLELYLYKMDLHERATNYWNNLPSEIRTTATKPFKIKSKSWIMEKVDRF